jgi:hypothetical protein
MKNSRSTYCVSRRNFHWKSLVWILLTPWDFMLANADLYYYNAQLLRSDLIYVRFYQYDQIPSIFSPLGDNEGTELKLIFFQKIFFLIWKSSRNWESLPQSNSPERCHKRMFEVSEKVKKASKAFFDMICNMTFAVVAFPWIRFSCVKFLLNVTLLFSTLIFLVFWI